MKEKEEKQEQQEQKTQPSAQLLNEEDLDQVSGGTEEVKGIIYKCPICGEQFSTRRECSFHRISAHNK